MAPLRIALTAGEPAGIGPDLLIQLAQQAQDVELVAIADPELLQQRASRLQLPLNIQPVKAGDSTQLRPAGTLSVLPIPLQSPCTPGELDSTNACYVLDTLDAAIDGCQQNHFAAMVTAPVQKSIINEAGIAFSGHTEYLAEKTHTPQVVMMLASDQLRVALVTTHLPLSKVPESITPDLLEYVLRILHLDLQQYFGRAQPRIAVLGLNPHAGENGHIGREEIDTIIPCLQKLQQQGFDLLGPLPADTAFTPKHLADCDAVLAMYHDQGLPVLKYQGFGQAVNITLGLPIIRTSVDHGTALDLAGTGKADGGSLQAALQQAIRMAQHRMRH